MESLQDSDLICWPMFSMKVTQNSGCSRSVSWSYFSGLNQSVLCVVSFVEQGKPCVVRGGGFAHQRDPASAGASLNCETCV